MSLSLYTVCSLALVMTVVSTNPEDYISYAEGNMALIISVPHGGYKKPSDFEDRVAGCLVNGKCTYTSCQTPDSSNCPIKTLMDSNTKEIAQYIAIRISTLTSLQPHVVINNLHRSKLDANREKDEATCGYENATAAYDAFHARIDEAKTTIGSVAALLVDIHGQTASENWIELGYTRPGSRLDMDHYRLNLSSMKSLALTECPNADTSDYDDPCWVALISGVNGLGKYLDTDQGLKTVPSPDYPTPNGGNYYSGGYNTKTYGSRYGGNMDAIQIELPADFRDDDNENMEADSNKVAQAIVYFMGNHSYISL